MSVSGWSGPSFDSFALERRLVQRDRLGRRGRRPGRPSARLFRLVERVGVVGAELRLLRLERRLVQRDRLVGAAGGQVGDGEVVAAGRACRGGRGRASTPALERRLVQARSPRPCGRRRGRHSARLLRLVSVSGWSGPSFDSRSLSVASCSAIASAVRPARHVGLGEVVAAGERVGVVGAELRLLHASASPRAARSPRRCGRRTRRRRRGCCGSGACSGWSGPSFDSDPLERRLVQRDRLGRAAGGPVGDGEVVAAVSVSGWSGPSFASCTLSVASCSVIASSVRPAAR